MLTLSHYEVVVWGESKVSALYRVNVQAFSEDEAKEQALQHWMRDKVADKNRPPKVVRVDVTSYKIASPVNQKELFERLADACLGEAMYNVQGAAVNLLITVFHKNFTSMIDAEKRWDELMYKGKEALKGRYAKLPTTDREKEIAGKIGAG
jgi:hypothetical protein